MIDIYKLMLYSNCTISAQEIAIYRNKGEDIWRASFHVQPDDHIEFKTSTAKRSIEIMSLYKFLESNK